jgi:hypothetical protein
MEMSKVIGFTQKQTSSGRLICYSAQLDCGHTWSDREQPWSPITSVQVGAVVDCETCANNKREEEWLEALDYSIVHHARFDPRFGGQYRFYRLDRTSPSNFMLIGGVSATPAIDKILTRKTNCGPLSPTEPA